MKKKFKCTLRIGKEGSDQTVGREAGKAGKTMEVVLEWN